MALGTTVYRGTDLAAMIPEIWTPIVLEELFAKTVAANFFTDLSPYAQDGGDIFHKVMWLLREIVVEQPRKLLETL